jgi:protein ImuA
MGGEKRDIIARLQQDILLLEGFKPPIAGNANSFGLGPIEAAFPNGVFPVGAVHEFVNAEPEHTAACGGFIGGLLGILTKQAGPCVWVSRSQTVFPPALKAFGVTPEQIIFVNLQKERDILWVTEEALKCEGLSAVIAELPAISFSQSRRLQLAVEESRVTGFILVNDTGKLNATACVARWRITPLPSTVDGELPGIGFPNWNIELLKVRNGNPGSWKLHWEAGKFVPAIEKQVIELMKYA